MLVTLPEALAHLRADPGVEDALVTLYLGAAEQSARDFLNRSVFADQAELDAAVTAGTAGSYPMVVNFAVKAAILLLLGSLYTNREEVAPGTSLAQLPLGARSLLRPYRMHPGF